MSIASANRKLKPCPRLVTVADLAALPSELPTGPVLWELDHGRLVSMPPPGDIHGGVEAKFTTRLMNFVEQHDLGKVRCGEVGIVLWRNPDRVVGADVVFIAKASLPLRISPEGYLETIPDLVVEVGSKNDAPAEIRHKVRDYLKAGVREVWAASPKSQTVTVYRRGQRPKRYKSGTILTAEDILPGFQVAVADVFDV